MIFIHNFFSKFIILIIILTFFSSLLVYYSHFSTPENSIPNISNLVFFPSNSTSSFFWPTPGYNRITSYFGKRTSPTKGASSHHSGIDIAANEGSSIYSVLDGKITFIGFKGAGGFTIIVSSPPFQISYCHISPNFIVSQNQYVSQKQLIAFVGPKYVNNVINNPYTDSSGKFTNGATTGPHLHITIKKDGIAVNPLDYF